MARFFRSSIACSNVAFGALALLCLPCQAAGSPNQAAAERPESLSASEKVPDGHPVVVLDRLSFPGDIIGAKEFEEHLRRSLKREAYHADWGAGRDNRIEYRFDVTTLRYTLSDGALRIECVARGRLPGGQVAKSELTFGGSQAERVLLTKRVLEIVARGVITRLAEMERKRRGLI